MDRNKVIGYTKIAELAREAGLFSTESPVLMPKLERFAALIERELRVDAEPVASVHIKDGCLIGSQRKSGVDIPDGQYGLYPIGTHPAPAVDAEPVVWVNKDGWIVGNDEGGTARPLYLHPAPAVVRQLVEALSRMTSVFLDTEGSYGSYETDAIEFAEQALAAAKGYTA